jgi:hypothetical protein
LKCAHEVDSGIHYVAGHGEPESCFDAATIILVRSLDSDCAAGNPEEHKTSQDIKCLPLTPVLLDEFQVIIVSINLSLGVVQ